MIKPIAADGNSAAMEFNNFFDPEETESGAFNIGDVFVVDPMELVEYSFLIFDADADAAIAELDYILFFITPESE